MNVSSAKKQCDFLYKPFKKSIYIPKGVFCYDNQTTC